MANSVIQIKRGITNAAPTGLANGEQAYTANGEVLFIGSPNGNGLSIAVGGRRFPGVLTANQALVANATSAIDKVIVANLVPTVVWANSAAGTDGQILTSNSTGGVYWGAAPSGVTNLSYSSNTSTITVESSSGTDVIITSANATNSGILTSSDWSKLNSLTANGIGATTNTQVFFNNSNTIGGDANFTYDTSTDIRYRGRLHSFFVNAPYINGRAVVDTGTLTQLLDRVGVLNHTTYTIG